MQEREYVSVDGRQKPERETEPLPAERTQQAQALERIERKIDAMLERMEGQE